MQISTETWFSIVVGGLLGWLLTHAYYLRQRQYLRPCFSVQQVSVLNADARIGSEIEVRFRGEQVPTLSVATVKFWNGGRKLLTSTDVARLDPLRVAVKGDGRILDVEVSKTTAIASGAHVSIDPGQQTAQIAFDHLDVDQGFVVRVLHTAAQDQINLLGTVIGAPLEGEQGTSRTEWLGRLRARCLLFLIAVFGLASVILSQMQADAQGRERKTAEVALWLAIKGESLNRAETLSAVWLVCVIACFACWVAYSIFHRSLRNVPPATLR